MRKVTRTVLVLAMGGGLTAGLLLWTLLHVGVAHAAPARTPWGVVLSMEHCDWNNDRFFTDPRDGQVYPQVQIGNQCWMARNLNYGRIVRDMDQRANGVGEKTCHGNDTLNCAEFGGLYTWEEAMRDQLCPDGWHVPTDAEWTVLERFLEPGVAGGESPWRGTQLARLLLRAHPKWDPPAALGASHFDVLPGGNAVSGWFFYLGRGAYFWTSTLYSKAAAWSRSMNSQTGQVYRGPGDKVMGFSIRCLKD